MSRLICLLNSFHVLTLYALMDSSFWFYTINLRWSITYIEGLQVMISKYNCISWDCFCLSNHCSSSWNVHLRAFHLSLCWLPKCSFRSHQSTMGTLTLQAIEKMHLKMPSAKLFCSNHLLTLWTFVSIEVNSVDPERSSLVWVYTVC